MTTLQLEAANVSDIAAILQETRTIWSGGLTADKYIHSVHHQLTHPWGQKHLRYLLLRSANEIVASLKFYSICISSRGQIYNFAGLGAIYTMAEHRRLGFGAMLVKSAIELAQEKQLDGLLLFSDIDPEFYSALGFFDLGGYNFELDTGNTTNFNSFTTALKQEHVTSLSRSYNRWLSRRSYGCPRSDLFWTYKVARENYFHNFSEKEWPGLQLLTLRSPNEQFDSYGLIEASSTTLRVLEVVGSEGDQEQLWDQIMAFAGNRGISRIRGFEGAAPAKKRFTLVERPWATPMILPLTAGVENWLEVDPCPLLELDHF